MDPPKNNLLLRLHKWARRQDENFLTESFAHLLQHLLENEPEAAVRFLESFTKGFFRLRSEEAKLVVVRTQILSGEGTPDLELRTARQLAYVEVKSESEPTPGQLGRYRRLLRDSGIPSTSLFLLTRYPATLAEGEEQPDHWIRWFQVADWIEQERSRYTFRAVGTFLVDQFLSFLGARNMVMSQVTWEMTGGVRAMRTLVDMLYEAANACGVKAQPWGSLQHMGVDLEKGTYWLGIDSERPEILEFGTYNQKVNKEAAERLGVGNVYEWPSKYGQAYGWKRELNLQAEEIHFFARSKASQLQFLESFLRASLDLVRQIELPEQDTSSESPSDQEAANGDDDLP